MLEKYIERLLFASRWLLAPLYLGLSLALIALGVKPPQAERAVLAAAHELGQDAAVEDLIRVGLKHRK